jgi:hypothetical protein
MINTVFNLLDSNGNAIYTKLFISAVVCPLAYSSSIREDNLIPYSYNGTPLTISLAPNTYIINPLGLKPFTISLPLAADNTTVNASNYVVSVNPTVNYNAATASFAQFAMTASYVSGGGGGSGATLTTGSTYPITASWSKNAVSASLLTDRTASVSITNGNIIALDNNNNFLALNGISGLEMGSNGPLYIHDSNDNLISMDNNNTMIISAAGVIKIAPAGGGTKFRDSQTNDSITIGDSLNQGVIGIINNTFNNEGYIAAYDTANVKYTFGNNIITADPNTARIGINNVNPGYELDVVGSINCSNNVYATQGNFVGAVAGGVFIGSAVDNVHIGLSDGNDTMIAAYYSTDDNYVYGNMFYLNRSGFAGINKSIATAALDVVGNIVCTGSISSNLLQVPYSSSNHTFTTAPLMTGSMYFKVSASTNFMFVYNGAKWVSSSMA